MRFVRRVMRSAAFYPITGLYIGGVACLLSLVEGWFDLKTAIVAFAFMAITAMLASARSELRQVHQLVNGQRHELLERIDQLTAQLIDSGQVPPARGDLEQDARDDRRRQDNKKVDSE